MADTYELMLKYNMTNRVFWVSPSKPCHAILREPPFVLISRCLPASDIFKLWFLWFFGLIWLFEIKDHNYNVLVITDLKYKQIRHLMQQSGRTGCLPRTAVRVIYWMLKYSRGLYQHLQKRGVRIVVWPVNETEEFEQVYKWYGTDIDGVMSDRPAALAEFIKKKSEQLDQKLK